MTYDIVYRMWYTMSGSGPGEKPCYGVRWCMWEQAVRVETHTDTKELATSGTLHRH
jgi:hypothetical protein